MFKLSYGGSYHKATAYGEGSGISLKLKQLNCDASDVLLNSCTIQQFEIKTDEHQKDLGITCFEQAVTGTYWPTHEMQLNLVNSKFLGLDIYFELSIVRK